MTREEYNSRANANVSVDEFEFINRAYMAAGDDIDKDQFCKDMKPAGFTPTMAALTERIESLKKLVDVKRSEISDLAYFIAEQAEKCSSSDLRKKAIALMGEKEYITWKIDNNKKLWMCDLELIKDLINE